MGTRAIQRLSNGEFLRYNSGSAKGGSCRPNVSESPVRPRCRGWQLEVIPTGSVAVTAAEPQGWTVSGLVVASGLPVLGFSDCWPTTAFCLRSRRDDGLRIPLAFALLLTLPCILFRYLPMVDLPQHQAVVSMILRLGDHDWAFDTPYLLQLKSGPWRLLRMCEPIHD